MLQELLSGERWFAVNGSCDQNSLNEWIVHVHTLLYAVVSKFYHCMCTVRASTENKHLRRIIEINHMCIANARGF